MPKKNSERVTDTVTLLPNRIPIPTPSLADRIKSISNQLIHLLLHEEVSLGSCLKPTAKEHILTLA